MLLKSYMEPCQIAIKVSKCDFQDLSKNFLGLSSGNNRL